MSSDNLTPMMRQYQRIKQEIPPDALLLFRLGDFYELFFDDAKIGSAALNLTLTKRNTIPMCGVPHHSAEGYIGKLLQAGHRVAICDQLSEPKPGQVVERGVTQIFSPGCVVNLDLTQPKENRFLAAVVPDGKKIGFAYLDLTTGDFRLTEVPNQQEFQDELIRLQPKELLHPSNTPQPQVPDAFRIKITGCDDWIFESDYAAITLREHFKVQSLDGFGCNDMTHGLGAAGALVHYVTKTLRQSAAQIQSLRTYTTHDFLGLDAATQRNLELIESTSSYSNTSLLKAIDFTVTAMGGRELRSWILHPLRKQEAIIERQDVINAWMENIDLLESFREKLQDVRDLERLISRISQGSANARDVKALGLSLESLPELQKIAEKLGTPLSLELAKNLKSQPEIIDLISKAIIAEPPLALKEGGIIATGYHAELDELHKAMHEGKNWIAELQAREQERTGIKSLKVRFNQVFGYYIEITKANLNQVPSDYTRKQTMVNAERFITPELKEMEGKILGAEDRARKLEYELFVEVRDRIAEKTSEIQATARAIAALDVLAGFTQLARLHDYHRPTLHSSGTLQIIEGRHPVIEQTLQGEKFVPNDTHIDHDHTRLIILTGPNMAGKSTYLRQVALIALLAHIGSYVPAKSATISILDRIFTRIGASDDLSRGQSTFMVEMNETANILNHATKDSLIILDEIGRGTSTFDGLSIAWAVAEYLNNQVQAKTLFATHYHELTELASSLPTVKNYNIVVREWHDQIIFLRKIEQGGADKSYGIQVARLAGLPKTVLERAKSILRNLEENELDTNGKPNLVAQPKQTRRTVRNDMPAQPQMDLFKAQKH